MPLCQAIFPTASVLRVNLSISERVNFFIFFVANASNPALCNENRDPESFLEVLICLRLTNSTLSVAWMVTRTIFATLCGDTDKAVFWYQPKDAETYRVIYGDLSVEDVAPESISN
jgi:hypothetical protein